MFFKWIFITIDYLLQIFNAQIGGWALAYRALVSRPLEFYLDNKAKFIDHDELMGFNDGGDDNQEVYDSDDVMTFHNLVTHDSSGEQYSVLVNE